MDGSEIDFPLKSPHFLIMKKTFHITLLHIRIKQDHKKNLKLEIIFLKILSNKTKKYGWKDTQIFSNQKKTIWMRREMN